jgi:hypothetical protein
MTATQVGKLGVILTLFVFSYLISVCPSWALIPLSATGVMLTFTFLGLIVRKHPL